MKEYLKLFMNEISEAFLRKHNMNIMQLELPQTTPANHRAADYMYELLKENGIDAERLNFVSDGETVYHDEVMPLCWDASVGKLTVLSQWDDERVIADYAKETFSLIRHSTSTPKEGLITNVIKWNDMMAGKDVKGALILLPYGMFPTEDALLPILNAGAIGLINGTVAKNDNYLDCVHWANNLTETNSWHVIEGERDFIGYCVTPRIHQMLERACEKGDVTVKAESDGHRYKGQMPAVTATIKGQSKKEFWVYAHLAEPLEDDNSSGIILSIAGIIAIKNAIEKKLIPELKYTLRVLFSYERYGIVAFANHFGTVLHDHCIGAIGVDGLPICVDCLQGQLHFSPCETPFYGNVIWEVLWDNYAKIYKLPPFISNHADYLWGDSFLSDTSVGLPTVSVCNIKRESWHNSSQRYNHVDYPRLKRVTAIITSMMAAVTICDKQKLTKVVNLAPAYSISRLADFANSEPPRRGTSAKDRFNHRITIELNNLKNFSEACIDKNTIDESCETIVNAVRTFKLTESEPKIQETPIYDSCNKMIPKRLTIGIPHDLARIPMGIRTHYLQTFLLNRVFSGMDGQRTLKELITQAEWDQKTIWDEDELKHFISTVLLLEKYNYIDIKRV